MILLTMAGMYLVILLVVITIDGATGWHLAEALGHPLGKSS